MSQRSRDQIQVDSPVVVLAVILSCSVPPPVRAAVTVMEYSVPSSRPVSVYIVRFPSTEVIFEPVKQSVSVVE